MKKIIENKHGAFVNENEHNENLESHNETVRYFNELKKKKELSKSFAELKKDFAKLKKLEGNDSLYYPARDKFVEKLRKFLYLEFTELSKENFLWLCDRVSTFRPVAPFSFLVSVSMRKGGRNG